MRMTHFLNEINFFYKKSLLNIKIYNKILFYMIIITGNLKILFMQIY
jgi:hypothetical protein